jgi:mRNA degradation ribonuclease J1/J2
MVNDNKALIQDIENKVSEIVNNAVKNKTNITDLKNLIILELSMYINKITGRRPMILPVVMEVSKPQEN